MIFLTLLTLGPESGTTNAQAGDNFWPPRNKHLYIAWMLT